MENMYDLLNEQPKVTDQKDPLDLYVNNGKIEFKNVKFSYNSENDEQLVLKDVSFTVEPGKQLAIGNLKNLNNSWWFQKYLIK
jgi:ABC-type multidrug transport system fused ATPase/permease subunit